MHIGYIMVTSTTMRHYYRSVCLWLCNLVARIHELHLLLSALNITNIKYPVQAIQSGFKPSTLHFLPCSFKSAASLKKEKKKNIKAATLEMRWKISVVSLTLVSHLLLSLCRE